MIIEPANQAFIRLTQCTPPYREAGKLILFFNQDVEGAIISHQLFLAHRQSQDLRHNTALMHHASCFVCAVRRVGRLLKVMVANRQLFPESTRATIRLEWRKKRAFFNSFVQPRNAVEHIGSEATDVTKWLFFHLHNDEFTVANGLTVRIGTDSLAKVVAARDAVLQVINSTISNPQFDYLDQVDA